MGTPKADKPRCDVYGCGRFATNCTDGTEVDAQGLGRKALPNINVCDHHHNWPFSTDAETFSLSDTYRQRSA